MVFWNIDQDVDSVQEGDTYDTLRGYLFRDVAPGFHSFPLSSSAIREDYEN
jgi:hypothetical protein